MTTEERLEAEVDRIGREPDRLQTLKRRSPEQRGQVVALSRAQERLLYRLAHVRGETRRHARVDDVDAVAAHHPGGALGSVNDLPPVFLPLPR